MKLNLAWCHDLPLNDSVAVKVTEECAVAGAEMPKSVSLQVPKLMILDAQNTCVSVHVVAALAAYCTQLSSIDVCGCARFVDGQSETDLTALQNLQQSFPDLIPDCH